ncbi:MAG: cell division protein FtsZ [Methanosarcinales archaeon]|nr:MAG: cell division protein FtsZ [Methanosarcinales archaeon]
MKSFIIESREHDKNEKMLQKPVDDDLARQLEIPRIIVVGCGGGGGNTINRLHTIGIADAQTIAINTDRIDLANIKANKRVLIGKKLTKGLGAGGYPEIGRKAAEAAKHELEQMLTGANLVFITAGMGGGTGTGSAPVVAQIAKERGAIVIGMVTSPFNVERERKIKAKEGLEELRKISDTVIVLENERLLNYVPNLPIDQAFSVMDQLIAVTVKSISETITQPSLINIDYADVRAIMKDGGVAVMLVGEAKGQDKTNEVLRQALNHPLLDINYSGATGCLLHMTGGTDMSLQEAEQIADALTCELDKRANVIWGARVSPDYEDRIQVLAIMTGIKLPMVLGSTDKARSLHSTGSIMSTKPLRADALIDII